MKNGIHSARIVSLFLLIILLISVAVSMVSCSKTGNYTEGSIIAAVERQFLSQTGVKAYYDEYFLLIRPGSIPVESSTYLIEYHEIPCVQMNNNVVYRWFEGKLLYTGLRVGAEYRKLIVKVTIYTDGYCPVGDKKAYVITESYNLSEE